MTEVEWNGLASSQTSSTGCPSGLLVQARESGPTTVRRQGVASSVLDGLHPAGDGPIRALISGPVSDCLFCRIVAGEIPATVVHETDRVLAFRDINPVAPTHVLVIPKE